MVGCCAKVVGAKAILKPTASRNTEVIPRLKDSCRSMGNVINGIEMTRSVVSLIKSQRDRRCSSKVAFTFNGG